MRKMYYVVFIALLTAGVVLAGCGSSNGGGAVARNPVIGVPVAAPAASPVASFAQTVPLAANEYNQYQPIFPGQANVWDIDSNFSLEDGGDDQFDTALELTVTTAATSSSFSYDQTHAELTFYTPTMSASNGVRTAVVDDGRSVNKAGYGTIFAITGAYSAFLNSTSDSRLQQTLRLAGAVGTVTASWNDNVTLCNGAIYNYNIPGNAPTYRVVVRDTAGTELAELAALSGVQQAGTVARSADLTSFVTTTSTIVLSFEQRSMHESYGYKRSNTGCYSRIDDVSVLDSAGAPHEYVTNGTFESGDMTGWTTNRAAEVQNMTSGVRTLAGLNVKRSFYTVPDKVWGRWVDVFENTTVSAVIATVTYSTNLGSDTAGIIYDTPGSHNRALTSWDGSRAGSRDRDIGMVFGLVSKVTYTSASGLGSNPGNDNIYFDHSITVPAGGRVAIVNFILMDGTDTGSLASTIDINARAAEIDREAAKIANNFWADAQYRDGMTQEQIDAVTNF